MIKIEFKEGQPVYCNSVVNGFYFIHCNGYIDVFGNMLRKVFSKKHNVIRCINHYVPTQDLYLDRSFILQQLGISKQQDEEMQQKYK